MLRRVVVHLLVDLAVVNMLNAIVQALRLWSATRVRRTGPVDPLLVGRLAARWFE